MMKDEYDFSKAERGKLSRPEAQFNLPVYLEAEVLSYLTEKAKLKGVELNQIVNDLLRKDIDLVEGLK